MELGVTVAHRKPTVILYLCDWRTEARLCAVLALAFALTGLEGCKEKAPLADDQIISALRSDAKPEAIKTALVELHARAEKGKSLEPWAPELVRLSKHPDVSVRRGVADLMGRDPQRKEFQPVLHTMLDSDMPLVCNAAAISLAAFDDGYGHDVLAAMLKPVVLTAPLPGQVRSMATNGGNVAHGDTVIRIEGSGEQTNVLATVSGKVRLEVETGDMVSGGSRLAVVQPSPEEMAAALKALQKVGKSQDVLYVAEVEADSAQPAGIREQAKLAHQRIIERTK